MIISECLPLKWIVLRRGVVPRQELLVRKRRLNPMDSKKPKQAFLLSGRQPISAVWILRREPVVWKSPFDAHSMHGAIFNQFTGLWPGIEKSARRILHNQEKAIRLKQARRENHCTIPAVSSQWSTGARGRNGGVLEHMGSGVLSQLLHFLKFDCMSFLLLL